MKHFSLNSLKSKWLIFCHLCIFSCHKHAVRIITFAWMQLRPANMFRSIFCWCASTNLAVDHILLHAWSAVLRSREEQKIMIHCWSYSESLAILIYASHQTCLMFFWCDFNDCFVMMTILLVVLLFSEKTLIKPSTGSFKPHVQSPEIKVGTTHIHTD